MFLRVGYPIFGHSRPDWTSAAVVFQSLFYNLLASWHIDFVFKFYPLNLRNSWDSLHLNWNELLQFLRSVSSLNFSLLLFLCTVVLVIYFTRFLHWPGPTLLRFLCYKNLSSAPKNEEVPIWPNLTITLLFLLRIVCTTGVMMGRLIS